MAAREFALGADGFVRMQLEAAYGTAVTDSMTDIPAIIGGTFMLHDPQPIKSDELRNDRGVPEPDIGRLVNTGQLQMMFHPSLLGLFLNMLYGAASTASVVDGAAYPHTFLTPNSGDQINTSYTIQQAVGNNLVHQMDGCVGTSITMESDNAGNIMFTVPYVAQGFTDEITRPTSFSYPSLKRLNFSNIVVNINPASASAFDQPVDSFNLTINTGLQLDRFKTGSSEILEPKIQLRPTGTFSCTVDADQRFLDYAHSKELVDITLTATGTEDIPSTTTGTPYSLVVELPGCILMNVPSNPTTMDRGLMDLVFDLEFGSASTGSSSATVQGEFLLTDGASTYPAAAS